MIQRKILIKGKVQGVGYRASTLREARKYPGVAGYVRNLPDGRVEAVFCGKEGEVNSLIQWCQHGPPSAGVTGTDVTEEDFSANRYTGFSVR